jgi:hypothetical protein
MLKKISFIYNGNRYVIDWSWIFLFAAAFFIAIIADKFGKPYSVFILVGIFSTIIIWIVMGIKKIEVIEKTSFNLMINIRCCKRNFERTLLHSPEDEIERYGLAIHRARKYLEGIWIVDGEGYLTKGFEENLEMKTVTLDINDSIAAIEMLAMILAGKKEPEKGLLWPHINYDDGGAVWYLVVDENGLKLN